MTKREPHFVFTEAGTFKVQAHNDGSVEITAPKGQEKWLNPLLWTFIIKVYPGYSAQCSFGKLILKPPDPNDNKRTVSV